MRSIANKLLNILFPPRCIACGVSLPEDTLVCDACRSGIRMHTTLFCAVCHARLPAGKAICHKNAKCLLGAAGSYEDGALRAIILALKFKGARSAADTLARMIFDYYAALGMVGYGAVIVPVPLSVARERARGFNQAEAIAAGLSRLIGLPLEARCLARTRNTRPQSELRDRAVRARNVFGCFAVANADIIRGKTVLLIDDVSTSGATLREAADTLKKAGAARVLALVAAKA